MSFKLGAFDTDSIEGFKAILKAWPALPVEVQLDDLPAGDGALYYQTTMTSTEWTFRLELTGSDVHDVLAKADSISRALNPLLGGLLPFTPNAADGWEWQGVLSSAIEWERDSVLWFSDQGVSRLAGEATVTTPNPYGYAPVSRAETAAPGALVLEAEGNTSYYPTVEFEGVLSSTQALIVNDAVEISGPLIEGQILVLDFNSLDFAVYQQSYSAWSENRRNYAADPFARGAITAFTEASSTSITVTKEDGSALGEDYMIRWTASGSVAARRHAIYARFPVRTRMGISVKLMSNRTRTLTAQFRPSISTSSGAVTLPSITLQAGVPAVYTVESSVLSPASSNSTAGLVFVDSAEQPGDTLDATAVLVEAGSLQGPVFDGDSTDADPLVRYQWVGTQFNSPSVRQTRVADGREKVLNVADRFKRFQRLQGIDNMSLDIDITDGTFTRAVASVRARRI